MNALTSEYKKIINQTPINVYVIPAMVSMNSNDYLKLFYEESLKEQENEKVFINDFRVRDFPKLFWRRLKGELSIIHHHWFGFHNGKTFLVICYEMFWMSLFRIIGGKIVWTIHNKYPHSKKFVLINTIFRKYMANILANSLHVHCRLAIDIMAEILNVKKNKFFVVHHPMYRVNIFSKEIAYEKLTTMKNELKIKKSTMVFLVYGQISIYKGIDEIVDSFVKTFGNTSDKILIIAGSVNNNENKNYINDIKIKNKYYINTKVFIIEEFCSNELTDVLFNIADYVVFNYTDILTSGGVALAQSYRKKVIAPNIGCLQELKDENTVLFDKLQVNTFNEIVENGR